MPSGRSDETLLRVRVQPRASRNEIVAWEGDGLRMRVSAPPVDGKANRAVTRLIAKALGVGRTSVTVVKGERSRDKVVAIDGVEPDAALRALGG